MEMEGEKTNNSLEIDTGLDIENNNELNLGISDRDFYIGILKKAGVNEQFINSSAGFETLSNLIDQTRNSAGSEFEILTPA